MAGILTTKGQSHKALSCVLPWPRRIDGVRQFHIRTSVFGLPSAFEPRFSDLLSFTPIFTATPQHERRLHQFRCTDITPGHNPRVQPVSGYRLVRLANGVFSVHSSAHQETFHPVIGPVAEAEALYVNQLRLIERRRATPGDFVVWDVGLGAAANALTILRAIRSLPGAIQLLSFDHTIEPLEFALQHAEALGYFGGYEKLARSLLDDGLVRFTDAEQAVDWTLHLGDFPTLLAESGHGQLSRESRSERALPAPHAILFDAYSPAKNPAMWTQPLFANIFRRLDPHRACAMPTYSRSTMLRVTLLLAGFFVGTGHATGEKEETTIAANALTLIDHPLERSWLERARRSTSAEPLWEAVYRQQSLSPATWKRLRAHPQFAW